MSAERLREAAALMRERAEKARTGDIILGDFWHHDLTWMSKRYEVIAIAGLGPAVALAVADLLDAQVAIIEQGGEFFDVEDGGDACALALANAYLGDLR